MKVEDYCKIIETCAANNVESLNIDNFSIKFQNGTRVEFTKSPDPQPMEGLSDIPNHEEIELEEGEWQEDESNETLLKAEELSLMALENPSKFEELLANEDSLLDEFTTEVEGL